MTGTPTRIVREVDRARRATGIGSNFPVSGYDDLTAAQVGERLGDLTPPELRKVRDYERRNANRKSVLAEHRAQARLSRRACHPGAGVHPRPLTHPREPPRTAAPSSS